jgi:hypothetical protein
VEISYAIIFTLQEKDAIEIEPECLVKVDEFGFFMHWKSEPRVRRLSAH